MKKSYKIEVDCANCANKMEEAAKKTKGVVDASVNFMALKMKVEFEEGADVDKVMKDVLANCKKVEDDCEIYITVEPCTMCYGAIEQSRIKKIVYGVQNENFGYFNRKVRKNKMIVYSKILSDDCEKLLHDFFIKKRR